MPDRNDHERRITSLEHSVKREAELRAAQDEDQSSIKQEVGVISRLVKALGETQSDHGYKLTRIDRELGLVRKDVEGLRNNVDGLRGDVSGLREDVSSVRGDVSGLREDVSGLRRGCCLGPDRRRRGPGGRDRAAGRDARRARRAPDRDGWASDAGECIPRSVGSGLR